MIIKKKSGALSSRLEGFQKDDEPEGAIIKIINSKSTCKDFSLALSKWPYARGKITFIHGSLSSRSLKPKLWM